MMTKQAPHDHGSGISPKLTYALAGALLGLGAPAGALLLRIAFLDSVRASPIQDMSANLFFYTYSLIGTCTVFAIAGAVAGARAERLRNEEAFYHRLSELDPLTGLQNERAFREEYARVRERSLRFHVPLSLLLIDVDRLKEINDHHGHKAGNAALRRVAEAIRKSKRTVDLAARWGGDEFAVVMEGAGAGAAQRVADSILTRLRTAEAIRVTVTIGIAGGVATEAEDEFFAAADSALYEGKRAGRDRVSVAARSSW